MAIIAGGTHVQDFINGVAFGRGVEHVLFDIAVEDPVYLYIVERRHRFYLAYIERILEAGKGRIDLVLCGDDFGSQRGLLISPTSFDKLFAAKKKELFDLVHSYGAKVTHHCCGSSRALIPRFIECGMDCPANDPAASGRYGPLRFEARVRRQDRSARRRRRARLAATRPRRRKSKPQVNRLMDEVGAGGG